jgi:bifunctional DNA-binding transcriptional regulator/antitoxin component of YhaV-PrlF toxin-antitoxin module
MCDYNKVWESMNELDMNSSKLSGIKEVINSATVSLEQHDYDATEKLLYAATDLINFYTEIFDKEFQKAWNIVIPAAKKYQDEQDKKLIENAKEKKSWVLPVEETKIAETDETDYFVTFPDDLLEAANLKEGDQVEWVDNKDGTFILRKLQKETFVDPYKDGGVPVKYEIIDGVPTLVKTEEETFVDPYKDDMIRAGYEMVDGVWTLKK